MLRGLRANTLQRFEPGEEREQDRPGGSRRTDQGQPAVFVDHLDPEFLGLLCLGSGPRPGDDQIGLGADRSRHLRAKRFGPRLGLCAASSFPAFR